MALPARAPYRAVLVDGTLEEEQTALGSRQIILPIDIFTPESV